MGFAFLRHRVQTDSVANQTPIHWEPGALTPGVKRPGREADNSPPSSVEVRNAWNYTSTSPTRPSWCLIKEDVFMAWYLVKHRDNFTLPLSLFVPTGNYVTLASKNEL
jgi:hypothetical protein